MLTPLEKRIIASIQGDIPVTERPYQELARRLEISEEDLIHTLQSLCERGVIRRFGATLKHQKSGFRANAMVAWQVPETDIETVGNRLAAFSEVTHCYRRNPTPQWPYNLYTMIHAGSEEECHELAGNMSRTVDVDTYTLLFSRRELKKTSMKYFQEEHIS